MLNYNLELNFKMKSNSPAKLFFYLIIILSLIEAAYFYNLLPERTAIHYNIKGQPDSWNSKTAIILINVGVVIFMALLFRVLIFFIRKIPEGLINLPNKYYWLAEIRKEETYEVINNFLFWTVDITLLFFVFLFYLIYQANINHGASIAPDIWIVMIVYIIALSILTIKFYKHFNKVPGK